MGVRGIAFLRAYPGIDFAHRDQSPGLLELAYVCSFGSLLGKTRRHAKPSYWLPPG